MRPGFFVSPQRRGGAESTAEIIAPAIGLAPIQKAMPSPRCYVENNITELPLHTDGSKTVIAEFPGLVELRGNRRLSIRGDIAVFPREGEFVRDPRHTGLYDFFDGQYPDARGGITVRKIAAYGVFERRDATERIHERITARRTLPGPGHSHTVVDIAHMIPRKRRNLTARAVDQRPFPVFGSTFGNSGPAVVKTHGIVVNQRHDHLSQRIDIAVTAVFGDHSKAFVELRHAVVFRIQSAKHVGRLSRSLRQRKSAESE